MFLWAHKIEIQKIFQFCCFSAIQFSTFGPLCTDLPLAVLVSTASGNLRCKFASNLKNHLILYFARCLFPQLTLANHLKFENTVYI